MSTLQTYETDYDEYLIKKDSLLNERYDIVEAVDELKQGIMAENIEPGVFGGIDNAKGVEFKTDPQTVKSSIQSRNFSSGSAGWQIDSDGNVEFNTGTFRGDLSIGSGNDIILADPDDATWRFGIGNASIASAPFRVDKTGIVYQVGSKTLETFTAGEAITAGNVVCIKNSTLSYTSSADTYVDENAPTTNYDDSTTLVVGSADAKMKRAFIKFNIAGIAPAAEQILKAELQFTVTAQTGFAQTLNIYRVTSDWSENGTVTWNNQPTVTSDDYEPGGLHTIATEAITAYTVDITELVQNWKNASYSNYGLRIDDDDASNKTKTLASLEHGTAASRPTLIITTTYTSDGKIYKTDSDDYLLCRNVVGIATETVSADASCSVQTAGKNTNVTCVAGERYFLSTTAGGISYASGNQTRLYRIGYATAENTLMIDRNDSNLFIKKFGVARISATNTSHYIPFPADATYAIVNYIANTGAAYTWEESTRVDIVTFVHIGPRMAVDSTTEKSFSIDVSYSNNGQLLTINSDTAASSSSDYLQYTVYFYK